MDSPDLPVSLRRRILACVSATVRIAFQCQPLSQMGDSRNRVLFHAEKSTLLIGGFAVGQQGLRFDSEHHVRIIKTLRAGWPHVHSRRVLLQHYQSISTNISHSRFTSSLSFIVPTTHTEPASRYCCWLSFQPNSNPITVVCVASFPCRCYVAFALSRHSSTAII